MPDVEQFQKLMATLDVLNNKLSALETVKHDSAAAQVILAIVPLVGTAFGVTLLFFFFLWQYRLKKELIRSNQYERNTGKNLKDLVLLSGVLCTAVGLPMTILFGFMEGFSYAISGGLIPLSTGIGLIAFYIIKRSE